MPSNGTRPLARRLWILGPVAAVPAFVGLAAISIPATEAEARQSDSEAAMDMVAAQIASFDISTTATGELEARQQLELRNPLDKAATITEIVPEGTLVQPGDLIVRFSTDQIEDQIDDTELQVEESRNSVATAESALSIQESDNDSRLRTAELDLELAKLGHQQWLEGDDVKKQKQLKVALENADRQLERLSEKYERSTKLLEQGYLSQDEWKLDGIRLAEAEANAQVARLDMDTYLTYERPRNEKQKLADVLNAEENLERVREQNGINLSNKTADLNSRKRRLDLRSDKLAELRDQLGKATVNAPTSGLVVYATTLQRSRWGNQNGPLQIGQRMEPNQLVVALPDTTEMIASVRVHEALAGRVRPGQPARVRIDAARGAVINATVESIGVMAEGGNWRDPNRREYSVRLKLEDGHGIELKPSMRCEADVILGKVEDSLSVPVQSIFADGSIRYVYTSAGSRFERTPVVVGRKSSTSAEILAGLEEGAMVLLREPSPGEVIEAEWDMDAIRAMMGSVRQQQGGRPGGRPSGRPGGAPQRSAQR